MLSSNITGFRYERCILSKRVRWDIDGDVIRGRASPCRQVSPDGLAGQTFGFLSAEGAVEPGAGAAYANIFGLVERFINARFSNQQGLLDGRQIALEALVRSAEELSTRNCSAVLKAWLVVMPEGYLHAKPNDVAQAVLASSTWAVLRDARYRVEHPASLSGKHRARRGVVAPVQGCVLYHWKRSARHSDELSGRHDGTMTRDAGYAVVNSSCWSAPSMILKVRPPPTRNISLASWRRAAVP